MSVLPEGWAQLQVGQLGELKLGKMLDRAKNQGQSTKYLRNVNVRWFRFDLHDLQELVVSTAELQLLSVRDGDLFICEGGEPGRSAVWKGGEVGLTYQKALHRFRTNGTLLPEVLMFQLRYLAENGLLSQAFTGTTIKHLTRESLQRLTVSVPPVNEQQRIADKLDTLLARLESCRERLYRASVLVKRLRQSVLEAALVGDLSEEWRELAGDSEKSWRDTRLDQIADVGTGSTPLRSNGDFYADSGTPWVTSSATGSHFVDGAAEFVTPAAIAAHRLKTYPPGTLLVAMYGEGKTRGQVTELRIHATVNQACAAIRVDESQALTAFVKLALWAQYEAMRALAEGGNQPNLNLTKIKGIAMRLPCKNEQAEIVRRVESLFALADAIEAKCKSARARVGRLTPAILAKAFRGELVPQDPNDEPASALLARLQAERGAAPARKTRARKAAGGAA